MSDFRDFYSLNTRIKRLPLSEHTKLIIMSDMHRGDGTGSDDFAHNSLIYKCALDYYLGCQMSDVRGPMSEVRGPMSEVRGRKADDRGRKTEDGGWRTEVRRGKR